MEKFDILLELQQIDINIDEEEKKKKFLPLKVEGIAREMEELQNNQRNGRAHYKELQIKLKKRELDLSDKCSKIKKHQEDLYGGKITDIKELRQLQKVIANYEKEKENIEDELLNLMEESEELNKSVKKIEERLHEKEAYLLKCQKDMERTALEIEEIMNSLNLKREKILSKFNDNRLLKAYEVLRKEKNGKAIVEVNSSICPGCYLDLPSDVIYHLKQNQTIIACPNCNRILIWKE